MRAPGRQGGIGLAEMLVALGLGLVVALAAAAMLLVANGDFAQHAASARIDDGGRYALELVGQALRQAAWTDLDAGTPPPDGDAAIAGLDNRTLPRMAAGMEEASPARTLHGSDVLAIRFAGSGTDGGDGSIVDCAGFTVGAGEAGWSIFYVGTAGDGETELRCKYRGNSGAWNADAIVRGVDSFQVLYGLDTDADGIPNRYLNATAVHALDAALPLSGATHQERALDLRRKTHWKRIVAVRAALLLHGEARSRAGSLPVRWQLFGGRVDPDDPGTLVDEAAMPEPLRLRARRLFDTVVLLRNRDG
ncbi:PilW family protein [Massilia sp. METH4]|uniref:PilW family protein n=1 Tax=Massilia sp. METH4 TaxID=3123041 RepID=UPI0030D5318E